MSQALAQWLEVADHQVTTRERYDDLIRLYLEPTLGSSRSSAVDAQVLERFYARLQRCRHLRRPPSRRPHQPPAGEQHDPQAALDAERVIRSAVRYGQLGVNPAALAEPPAFQRGNPDPPSPTEAAALLNAAWSDPEWGLFLWLSMVTGSRRGETRRCRRRGPLGVRDVGGRRCRPVDSRPGRGHHRTGPVRSHADG